MKTRTKDYLKILKIAFGIAVPGSVFWILYRYGYVKIIDTLAQGILMAAAIWLALWLLIQIPWIKISMMSK